MPALANPLPHSGRQDALDLVESARTEAWDHPSFLAELYQGNFRFDLVFPFPKQPAEDQKVGDAFLGKLEDFLVKKVDSDAIDRIGDVPKEVLNGLIQLGAFGMKIDTKYGGLGLSTTNYVRAMMLLGGHCANITAWLSAHQSIGVPQPLKLAGTEQQKKTFLPRLVREVSAFALTEPSVGSDPAAMETHAEPSADGKYWILNGQKLWCTNGAVATLIVVMARTPDIEVHGKKRKQVSAFIVENNMPGFRVVHRCRFMGLHGIQNALLEFKNVQVPRENLIGEPGQGLKIAFETLNVGRLSLPAACVGGAKKCLEILRHWTKDRVQWGASIGAHEEVAHKSAHAAANTFAMEAMTFWTARLVDRGGRDIRIEAATSKLFATELSWKIAYDTLQIRGGRGFESSDSLRARGETPIPVERMMRDLRINTILEGSTEVMHLFIAREALDSHMRRVKALLDPRASLSQKLTTFLWAGLFYAVWYPKQWIPLQSLDAFRVHRKLRSHLRYMKRTSRKLARTSFHLMLKYGPKLEQKELQLARIVEIGTELFAMGVSCAKAQDLVDLKAQDRDNAIWLADFFCKAARTRIKGHFRAMNHNQDRESVKISQALMDARFQWLEDGTVKNNIPFGREAK